MDIIIGIINFNTKRLLQDCLDSIKSEDKAFLNKTIVVDNASTDGSQELISKDYPMLQLIKNKENLGYAKAANQIIKNSKSKFIFILNSDTILKDKAIKNIINFLETCPQAGAVGPLLLNMDGSIQISGRRFPSFIDATVHAFLGVLVPNNRFSRRYKLLDWDRKRRKEVDWVSGAALCLRRKAIEAIGLFDENYFMYVEDMDICYRLRQNGWKVFLLPEAKVIHYIGESSSQVNKKMIVEFQKSIYRFFLKQNAHSLKRYLAPLVKGGLFFRKLLLLSIIRIRKEGK